MQLSPAVFVSLLFINPSCLDLRQYDARVFECRREKIVGPAEENRIQNEQNGKWKLVRQRRVYKHIVVGCQKYIGKCDLDKISLV